MNIRELTYVALKITGIVNFIWGLRMWGLTLGTVSFLDKEMPHANLYLVAALIPFIFSMLIAFLLLAQTNRVVEWMSLPDAKEKPDEIRVESFLHACGLHHCCCRTSD